MILLNTLQIAALFLCLLLLTKPVGLYLYRIYETSSPFPLLNRLEGRLLKWCCFKHDEQDWKAYLKSLLVFNFMGIMILFLLERFQGFLPLNPQNFPSVPWDLALNVAVSFTTNTNWQAYSGETTMSYFTQMIGLTWQNFVSASTGMTVFLALARGLSRHPTSPQDIYLGNFCRLHSYWLRPASGHAFIQHSPFYGQSRRLFIAGLGWPKSYQPILPQIPY